MLQKIALVMILMISYVSNTTFAGVQIGGSRVIYSGNSKQATISIHNPDTQPYMIQSWVNKQEEDDNDETFITTPPLFRLEPQSQNSIRIIYSGHPLPQDKESVYWLNIKTIPSTDRNASNALLITVKSRLKLFYRPPGLEGDGQTAYQQLQFRQHNGKLIVYNPTPFSVSFQNIKVNGHPLDNPGMVLPMQEMSLGNTVKAGSEIRWQAINDFGGITEEAKVRI